MSRVPILSTVLVVLASAAMVALGVWQLSRLREKEALIARYQANQAQPLLPLSIHEPLSEGALYRRVSATCTSVLGWQVQAGRSAAGTPGWRHIATCPLAGARLAVDLGVSDQSAPPAWAGGVITGRLIEAPTGEPLIERLFAKAPPPTPMIVSDQPAPGLARSADPDPSAIPNNHLAYAVQWFLFAAVALIVYALALRRRGRSVAPPPPRR